MMRVALETKRPRRTQIASVVSLPAPIGGWNARDSIAKMPPLDAVEMENWFPGTTSLAVRGGYSRWSTGYPAAVETVMVWTGPSSSKLFGVSNSAIYEATAGGAIGAALVSSLGNSRFQYVNFATTGGAYIIAVNGSSVCRQYDGTNWHKDGDGAPWDITGVSSASLINVTAYKNRLWFVEKNKLKLWYLPIQAIGGAATSFDLSSIFSLGGYIVSIATQTIDAGYGVDDYMCIITSEGEVACYRLTDPTTPTGIALVGIFVIGRPCPSQIRSTLQ